MLFSPLDNGPAKAARNSQAIIIIIIAVSADKRLPTHLQRRPYRRVRAVLAGHRVTSFLRSSWTLILVETIKHVLSYKSANDLMTCDGLWKTIELPLKICQTAAFLEVRADVVPPSVVARCSLRRFSTPCSVSSDPIR